RASGETGTPVGAMRFVRPVLASVLVGSAALVAILAIRSARRPPSAPPTVVVTKETASLEGPPAAVPPQIISPPPPAPPAAQTVGSLSATPKALRKEPTRRAPSEPAAVEQEEAAGLLRAARALRREHDPTRASALLDEYLRRYPHGSL